MSEGASMSGMRRKPKLCGVTLVANLSHWWCVIPLLQRSWILENSVVGTGPEESDAGPCTELCWETSSRVQGRKGSADVVPALIRRESKRLGVPYLTLRPFTDVIILILMSPFTVNTLALQWICLSFHEDSGTRLILPDTDAASDLTSFASNTWHYIVIIPGRSYSPFTPFILWIMVRSSYPWLTHELEA